MLYKIKYYNQQTEVIEAFSDSNFIKYIFDNRKNEIIYAMKKNRELNVKQSPTGKMFLWINQYAQSTLYDLDTLEYVGVEPRDENRKPIKNWFGIFLDKEFKDLNYTQASNLIKAMLSEDLGDDYGNAYFDLEKFNDDTNKFEPYYQICEIQL